MSGITPTRDNVTGLVSYDISSSSTRTHAMCSEDFNQQVLFFLDMVGSNTSHFELEMS